MLDRTLSRLGCVGLTRGSKPVAPRLAQPYRACRRNQCATRARLREPRAVRTASVTRNWDICPASAVAYLAMFASVSAEIARISIGAAHVRAHRRRILSSLRGGRCGDGCEHRCAPCVTLRVDEALRRLDRVRTRPTAGLQPEADANASGPRRDRSRAAAVGLVRFGLKLAARGDLAARRRLRRMRRAYMPAKDRRGAGKWIRSFTCSF
jgi:hypothetical protein